MLTPKTKSNISRIIPIALIWLIFSIIYTLLERGLLGTLPQYPSTGNPYNFSSNIIIIPLTAWVTGFFMGTVEVLYLNKVFIKKTLTQKIVFKTALYVAIIIFFLFGLTLFANTVQLSVFSPVVWNNAWAFFSNYSFWSVAIYIGAIIGVSLFYTEVNENLGQGVLTNFFTGKYHTPKEEERIFMFLDMKSSTTIAETIGHVRYFEMLKEYFSDLTDPIIEYSGEIYQYVGDEIVVSWKLRNGLLNNNCIQCFFALKQALDNQHKKYLEKFGIQPEFKAGFHIGKVTTGEIGVIKKQIIFTGDVLNTTARIQSLCNTYGVDILISGQLVKKLSTAVHFQITSLGECELRGRDERIELYTCTQSSES